MKKIYLIFFLLISPYIFFAENNINILGGFSTLDYRYTKNNCIYKIAEEPKFYLGISNYNYFILKKRFGLYEKINITLKEKLSIENIFGGCVKLQPTKKITIDGGPAFHLYCNFFEKDSNDNINLFFGFTQNTQVKINIWNNISTIIGFDLSLDPYCINLSKDSNQWYYEKIKDFINISFSPYIGISYNY